MEERNMPRRPRREKADDQPRNESLVYGKNPVTELLKSGSGVDTVLLAEGMAPAVAAYYTAMAKEVGAAVNLEDIDVGYRARIAGYDNIYCPAALVWHVGSGTSGSKYNSFKVKLAARNNVYLNYKNMPCLQLIINAIPIAAGIFVKYSFFRKLGFGKDYLEGLKEGIRTAKKCKKVAYRPERLKNYLAIELELLAGTFLYVYEFAVRQIEKKAASDKS